MNARALLHRYLRQRREAGELEVFLEGLTAAETLALLESPEARRTGAGGVVDRAGAPAPGSGRGRVAGAARGSLLQALAEHAPGVIGAAPAAGLAVTAAPAAAGSESLSGSPGADSTPSDPSGLLTILSQEVAACTRCRLHRERQQVVFGEGNPRARVVVVGEAPGREEDRTGRPFVGSAGKLLDLLLMTAGFPREEVYICNVIKCRPPENRNPMRDEVEACSSYLHGQLAAIQPAVLLALGKFAAQTLVGSEQSIGSLRGRVHSYQGIPLVVTFHPAFLLRSPQWARAAWDDFQLLRQVLDESGQGGRPA